MNYIGKSNLRVDAYGKVTGKAKYTADLAPKDSLIAKVLHSTIANGEVVSMDVSAAKKVPGVVGVFTCFDVPDVEFPTAGHPWSTDPKHQDIADKKLLNQRVRFYGDDIAAVVAENDVAASQALKLIKVEYKEYPVHTDARSMLNDKDAIALHPNWRKDNVIAHTSFKSSDDFDYDKAKLKAIEEYGEENLIEVVKNVKTPRISHCHIELPVSYAYVDSNGKVTVVASTQLPHICRRVVAQALNIPWGKVRVIKPYIGGGFGNKQDMLYEPLNAWLSVKCGGKPVILEIPREDTMIGTRTRHPMDGDVRGLATKDGKLLCRELKNYSTNGGYAAHGHSITAKCAGIFQNLYKNPLGVNSEAWTVWTNAPTSAAMRAYGVPQAVSFAETLTDDICFKGGFDPLKFRLDNLCDENLVAGGVKFYTYGLKKCLEIGAEKIGWYKKREAYKNQTGPIRKGVGICSFIYQTAVAPIALETASVRMILNQDGSMQLSLGATEIGQGADTIFTQIAAESTGISPDKVYVISTQDTDVTPFDTGAYGSRQTYVTGNAIKECGLLLKKKICEYALLMEDEDGIKGKKLEDLDVSDNYVVDKNTMDKLIPLDKLSTTAFYSFTHNQHITAEKTTDITTNTFASGCTFVDLEVDMPLGIINVKDIISVHDSGTIINPALATAQVHGGMSMSLGYGMSEELILDPVTGKAYNNNMLDYKIPTAMDSPDFKVEFVVMKDPTGGYGNKALGEPPTVAPAVAVRNAVLNATGIGFNEFPLTAERLVHEFKAKGLI
ncbi:MAG: xanthine dehydrogenase molybdenum-binding subunit XdhA [Lachnospiraceae bacterium]|nr:xanthine dehydrogenase molybdenum-binding subunit XdhA [Lachnospiraceae bacterium]